MIPKQELRVGNWVLNKEGNFCKIASGASIDAAESFTPIALDDELLRKCGFIFHEYFKLWQKSQLLPKTGYLMAMDQDYNVKNFGQTFLGVHLTTLHQLQNLLFQLKGVELDIAHIEDQELQPATHMQAIKEVEALH